MWSINTSSATNKEGGGNGSSSDHLWNSQSNWSFICQFLFFLPLFIELGWQWLYILSHLLFFFFMAVGRSETFSRGKLTINLSMWKKWVKCFLPPSTKFVGWKKCYVSKDFIEFSEFIRWYCIEDYKMYWVDCSYLHNKKIHLLYLGHKRYESHTISTLKNIKEKRSANCGLILNHITIQWFSSNNNNNFFMLPKKSRLETEGSIVY